VVSFTRKVDYALVALARLADGGEQAGPVSARQIAEEFDLPLPLLMNILKDLQRAGLIGSTRGARGGYYLSDDPREIVLLDVVQAVEGPVQMAPCCNDRHDEALEGPPCQRMRHCPASRPMQHLQKRMVQMLAGVNLHDLFRCELDIASDELGIAAANV
jgi:Rrf2 family protein